LSGGSFAEHGVTKVQIKSDENLLKLLNEAAHRSLSRSELLAQRVSFIMGNLPKESTLTRERVEELLESVEGDTEAA